MESGRIAERCRRLALCSEQPGGITRVFLSPEQRAANALVMHWMTEAGMNARLDAIGNVIGRYEGDHPGLPCLMLGSHLDTVRDAGSYDGILGVVTAVECVASLHARGVRLPFAIEVIGFGDEEGVRFGATLLGSRAVAGAFPREMIGTAGRDGVTLGAAMRDFGLDPAQIEAAARRPEEVLAYAELHIEQGPVLESEGLSVGVVTAINGFTRMAATIEGIAGHAGTMPMSLRADALAAAAECVLAVERIATREPELVATVGRIEALPGAINVIPGRASFTVDLRAPDDNARIVAVQELTAAMKTLCARRGVSIAIDRLQDTGAAACAPRLMAQMERAIAAEGLPVRRLPSGAGHDGMAISAIADICMLFVRCERGISHNPAEAVSLDDIDAGRRVLRRFVEDFDAGAQAALPR